MSNKIVFTYQVSSYFFLLPVTTTTSITENTSVKPAGVKGTQRKGITPLQSIGWVQYIVNELTTDLTDDQPTDLADDQPTDVTELPTDRPTDLTDGHSTLEWKPLELKKGQE